MFGSGLRNEAASKTERPVKAGKHEASYAVYDSHGLLLPSPGIFQMAPEIQRETGCLFGNNNRVFKGDSLWFHFTLPALELCVAARIFAVTEKAYNLE